MRPSHPSATTSLPRLVMPSGYTRHTPHTLHASAHPRTTSLPIPELDDAFSAPKTPSRHASHPPSSPSDDVAPPSLGADLPHFTHSRHIPIHASPSHVVLNLAIDVPGDRPRAVGAFCAWEEGRGRPASPTALRSLSMALPGCGALARSTVIPIRSVHRRAGRPPPPRIIDSED
uniref:Uncharacterized protein n=1 Tax=Mycena chlorophos TaxID=658473 RepID=A0ABQ0L8G2_MYCCL|nr:predicted protein [Mycena chlorophos]